MSITVINNFQQFDDLKSNWNAVYSSDTNATFFVSWPWLRGWFEVRGGNWFVLAYKPNNTKSYVAFFPLSTNKQQTRIVMGGNDIACHTGFLCMPEHEKKAITSFAEFIKKQNQWEEFKLGNVSDPRVDHFIKNFSHKKYTVKNLDHLVCPVLTLPATWDKYLQTFLNQKRERT